MDERKKAFREELIRTTPGLTMEKFEAWDKVGRSLKPGETLGSLKAARKKRLVQ